MKNKVLVFHRKRRGKSQKALAKELDVTREYISLLENSKKQPSSHLARRIAKYFGTTAEAVFPTYSPEEEESQNST
jgi:DNA-binding XRE family transcriptional regulator